MKLNELRPQKGAVKRKMRVGRGIGSGKGKTSGRGVKGQKARTGVSVNGFEGGQTPLHRRIPKSGFTNIHALNIVTLTTGRLQEAIDSKLLDPKNAVDEAGLVKAKVLRRKHDGIKLVVKGELKGQLQLTLTAASKGAIEAVEKAGGKITLLPVKENKLATGARKRERDKEKKAAEAE